MLKNFFTTAFRSLSRNKAHTTINIAGLALGIACCLVLFLVVRYERSFDRHHAKADRIYRVNTQFLSGEGCFTANAPIPLGQAIKEDCPEAEEVTTTSYLEGDGLIKVDNQIYKEEGIAYVAPNFVRIFDVTWLAGNPQDALSEPNAVVLSKSIAQKYFGQAATTQPDLVLGKTIKLNNKYTLKVTGLVADFPATTDLPFEILISYASLPSQTGQNLKAWDNINSSYSHFVLLRPRTDPKQLEKKFPAIEKKHTGENKQTYLLQPLREMHHDRRFDNYNGRTMPVENINALILIGVFILLTACINFINLATAQSFRRSREVGIRKVLGANRPQLIRQFISETFLLTVAAMLLAGVAAYLILPYLQGLLEAKLAFQPWRDQSIITFLAGITVVVTVLAGFYPALILSGFKPVLALKNKITAAGSGGLSLRRGLIVMQFVIAQALIIGTVVVSDQLSLFRNRPIGYNPAANITVPFPANTKSDDVRALRTQLKQLPGVKNVSFSLMPASSSGDWSAGYNFEESGLKDDISCIMMPIDADFLDTYGLTLLAGRNLRQTDTAVVVVNEAVLRTMGIKNAQEAIGRKIKQFDKQATIVGVVKDYHVKSLKKAISPIVMIRMDWLNIAGIKMDPASLRPTIAQVEQLWKQTFPESIFEFTFLEDDIAKFYEEEVRMYRLFRIFAGIAIFISCLGLYGLVSFMAVQRTKEIGIRKVLGASVANIVALFTKEFFALILIAFAVAAPLAWFFMHAWLQNFEYQVNLGLGIFLTAILFSLVIAGITIVYRSVRAALTNPVQNLRSE
ncbi:MAG: Acidobacterial duplicated orphan permease (function unknown) [uncultured Adhaeribacter sp.]|uniref:ABC transporter, permease protein n=1 Tax=uncultured Adhaeribacter sp. TaxID=448109 RepID=A0A6J4H6E6_9BACT|nr:MAG: Acidobacterial duplicated orphan permease (function unknown) [uncultured Adhaeribacter sp.]